MLTFCIIDCSLNVTHKIINMYKEKGMRFISVRDFRLKPSKVWELAKQEKDVILTTNGRPVAILTGVDENSLGAELDAIQRARALSALESIHLTSVEKGTDKFTENEIKTEIDDVRNRKAC